jgi:hypothetical protein
MTIITSRSSAGISLGSGMLPQASAATIAAKTVICQRHGTRLTGFRREHGTARSLLAGPAAWCATGWARGLYAEPACRLNAARRGARDSARCCLV